MPAIPVVDACGTNPWDGLERCDLSHVIGLILVSVFRTWDIVFRAARIAPPN